MTNKRNMFKSAGSPLVVISLPPASAQYYYSAQASFEPSFLAFSAVSRTISICRQVGLLFCRTSVLSNGTTSAWSYTSYLTPAPRESTAGPPVICRNFFKQLFSSTDLLPNVSTNYGVPSIFFLHWASR